MKCLYSKPFLFDDLSIKMVRNWPRPCATRLAGVVLRIVTINFPFGHSIHNIKGDGGLDMGGGGSWEINDIECLHKILATYLIAD